MVSSVCIRFYVLTELSNKRCRSTLFDARATVRPSSDRLLFSSKDGDDYEHLTTLFAEMTALSDVDQDRKRVRTQIIEACLPIAEHIADRYRGRGQPHGDLFRQQAWVWSVSSTDSTSTKGKTSWRSLPPP